MNDWNQSEIRVRKWLKKGSFGQFNRWTGMQNTLLSKWHLSWWQILQAKQMNWVTLCHEKVTSGICLTFHSSQLDYVSLSASINHHKDWREADYWFLASFKAPQYKIFAKNSRNWGKKSKLKKFVTRFDVADVSDVADVVAAAVLIYFTFHLFFPLL